MRVKVLDHGYIFLVEHSGSDERIIEAARMSTGKGFLGWGPHRICKRCGLETRVNFGTPPCPKGEGYEEAASMALSKGEPCDFEVKPGDEKLLRYLYVNQHSTPFEMATAVFEVQAPIFVFREWHRHRTQSYSELSSRYTPLSDVNYIPTVERLMLNSKTNKQAGTIKDAEELTEEAAHEFQKSLEYTYAHAEQVYQSALNKGVPKELARVHLPVGRYSRMRASANLLNWIRFLRLREAPNAQWEIRVYAEAVHALLREKFPRTMALYEEEQHGRAP